MSKDWVDEFIDKYQEARPDEFEDEFTQVDKLFDEDDEDFSDDLEDEFDDEDLEIEDELEELNLDQKTSYFIYFERLFLRSRRYTAGGDSDLIINSNIQPQNEEAWTDEKTSKNISNSIKNNLYYFGKIKEGIDGIPNEESYSKDSVISVAKNKIQESRAFIRQELFGIKEFVEIREEDPDALKLISKFNSSGNLIDLSTEVPSSRGAVRRWNDKLYVSYSQLASRQGDQTYYYTGFNTWEITDFIYSWQRQGYGPTILSGTQFDGTYNYGKGYGWNGYKVAPTFDNTPYYVNSSKQAGFFWNTAQSNWVFITDVDINRKSSNGSLILTSDSLIEQLSDTQPEKVTPGNVTIPDVANGGVINFTVYYPTYISSPVVVTEYLWQNLGEINEIISGDVQYPYVNPETGSTVNVTNPAGKLLFANNGHLYIGLYNLAGLGPYSTTANIGSQNYGTPPGGLWHQVSYRTYQDLQPAPGEVISPIGVQTENTSTDNTLYKRIMNYRRTRTETVQVADPGSAYIPVYCASYFLEPYVSEAGKNANF